MNDFKYYLKILQYMDLEIIYKWIDKPILFHDNEILLNIDYIKFMKLLNKLEYIKCIYINCTIDYNINTELSNFINNKLSVNKKIKITKPILFQKEIYNNTILCNPTHICNYKSNNINCADDGENDRDKYINDYVVIDETHPYFIILKYENKKSISYIPINNTECYKLYI
jgi:hypothetical protein